MSALTTVACAHRRGQSYWLNYSSSSKGMLGFGRREKEICLFYYTWVFEYVCQLPKDPIF